MTCTPPRDRRRAMLAPMRPSPTIPISMNGSCTFRSCSYMDYLDLLQWPAMVVTVVAAYLVASRSPHKRAIGFWCFLASNVLWVVWGMHDHAWALVGLQFFLAA